MYIEEFFPDIKILLTIIRYASIIHGDHWKDLFACTSRRFKNYNTRFTTTESSRRNGLFLKIIHKDKHEDISTWPSVRWKKEKKKCQQRTGRSNCERFEWRTQFVCLSRSNIIIIVYLLTLDGSFTRHVRYAYSKNIFYILVNINQVRWVQLSDDYDTKKKKKK